jgi:hypothetical protein
MARGLAVKIQNAINNDRKDLYEATRGNWSAAKASCNSDNIAFVVGIYEGKVLSAYIPTQWYTVIADGEGERERRRFDGIPVDQETFSILRKSKNEEKILNSFGNAAAFAYVEIDGIDL